MKFYSAHMWSKSVIDKGGYLKWRHRLKFLRRGTTKAVVMINCKYLCRWSPQSMGASPKFKMKQREAILPTYLAEYEFRKLVSLRKYKKIIDIKKIYDLWLSFGFWNGATNLKVS